MIRSVILSLFIVCLIALGLASCSSVELHREISGTVFDGETPVEGALIRIQTTELQTLTDADGQFAFNGLESNGNVFITAWKSGYYIVGVEVHLGETEAEIHLHRHADEDNPAYQWLPSQFHPGQGEDQGCAECHSREGTEISHTLPVDEWLLDAHSQTATNPRFLTMYNGTDIKGNKSPKTRYGTSRDYGTFPLKPDPGKPYYGPGYKLDFPDTQGNCAACHTPAASVNNPYGVDPTLVTGVAAEGVPCDFCHKIWDVHLDPETGLPYANMPGVLSYEFRRPPEDHQFFAGPLDDVAPGEDTYSSLQQQSQICAPCHFGIFWDTVVYNSFGEWLDSPYSNPQTGQTCQDCHMPPLGANIFAKPEVGGLKRDPETIFSHRMPGAVDEDLLANAVSMAVEVDVEGEQVVVQVTITNDKTGHHVPTDSPMRHMILLVSASDPAGNPLAHLSGLTVPDWCGLNEKNKFGSVSSDLLDRNYAGLPGTAYAKVLMELWTEITPTGAYWNPTQILMDNRIPAFEIDTTHYSFALPDSNSTQAVNVQVRLIYRRAFLELIQQKGWNSPDILMESQDLTLKLGD